MHKKHITFESGKEYTLAQILSGNNKIVIPDLQRDYCWGDKAFNKDTKENEELVTDFVNNLIDSCFEKSSEKITLGLLYGYEHPKNRIQLCDGQQRITTLFLLLGMINRKTRKFSQYLISDKKEPYLQYAIRESTLYFLDDLVDEFFINESDYSANQINEQKWYFSEYKEDASIQSMIAALQRIENTFSKSTALASIDDFSKFGNFILHDLEMFYYDMGNRTQGEETFVVINTTGEPLTATEHLKPVLLGDLDNNKKNYPNISGVENQETKLEYYSRQWEDMEKWFWQNRTKSSKTADGGLKDFFVWYWQIGLLQEEKTQKKGESQDIEPIKCFRGEPGDKERESRHKEFRENLDNVHEYFQALSNLIKRCENDDIRKVLQTITENKNPEEDINLEWFRKKVKELFVILPLIAYLKKFPEAEKFYEFVRRIRKNYFDYKRKRDNFVNWRHIIQIIDFAKTEKEVFLFETKANEILFEKFPNVDLEEWCTEAEKEKNLLKREHKKEIEEWEDHIDLMGDLTPLLEANKGRENNYENLEKIWKTFSVLYNCYDEEQSKRHPILSNYVRLYRVLIEQFRIGHINRTSGMRGAWFSWKNSFNNEYLSYLEIDDYRSLWQIEEENIIIELKNRIKKLLPKENVLFSQESFDSKKHLKAWFLIKVLHIEEENGLLSFSDGGKNDETGYASYNDCSENKINKNLDFTLANSICGYAEQSGRGGGNCIHYANEERWGNSSCFDTTIGKAITFKDFKNREEHEISPEKIEEVNREINNLIEVFYS